MKTSATPSKIPFWQAGLLLFWLLFSLVELSAAHGKQVSGRIFENETNTPLFGVRVEIPELERGTYTDESGYFQLDKLPLGTHELRFSLLGYQDFREQVRIQENEASELKIQLISKPLELAQVDISSNQFSQGLSRRVSGLDLKLRPVQSAQEVLRVVPGLFIAQHAGGGKAEQIFLRGFDIDHGTDVAIDVDGIPANMVSHAHGQGYADLHFLIPEAIEAVDFEKGPYFAQVGNFATAGHVSMRTRTALDRSQFGVDVGQYNQYRAVGLFDLLPQSTNHHAYIASEYLFSEGYFDSPQNLNRLNVMGKYTGVLNDNSLLSITATTFRSRWDASGQIPLRAVQSGLIGHFGAIDDTEGGETRRNSLNLSYQKRLPNGANIEHRLFYVRSEFELYSNFTFFLEDGENGDQIRQREDRNLYGYRGSYSQEYQAGKLRFRTEAGLDLRVDEVLGNELSQTANRNTLLNSLALGDVREQNVGAYVDQAVLFPGNVTLNLGVRYDQFRFSYEDALTEAYDPKAVTQGKLSPNAKLSYRPHPHVQLYAQAGSGFHSNDSRVILAQTGEEILPRAYGADLGAWLKPVDQLLIRVAAWSLRSEQEFVYVGDAGIVEPGDPSQRMGVDLSLRGQLTSWLWADADVTYSHGRTVGAPEGENLIPLAPVWTGTGGLNVRLTNGWELIARGRYLGDRPADESYSLTADGYFLLDGIVRYTHSRYQIGLELQNLLNTEWKEAQFATTSRLKNEPQPTTEIHYTPGTPFLARLSLRYFF